MIDIVHSGYVAVPDSLTSRVGIFRDDSDIMGFLGGGGVGGLGVVVRDITGLGGSDGCSSSGLGTRDGALDAVCDLVIARLLPRLGVRGGGFGVFGKSPGNGLLLDPLLIYRSMRVGGLIAFCVRLVTKKSICTVSRRE